MPVALNKTKITVTDTSQEIIVQNNIRKFLLIQNKDGANAVYLNIDTAATSATPSDLILSAGSSFLFELNVPLNSFHAACLSSKTANIIILEG